MGRKKAQSNLGQTLIKDRFRNVRSVTTSTGERALVHTSELEDGYDWARLGGVSVTEEDALQDFLHTAELAGTEFTAEKLNVKIVTQEDNEALPSAEKRKAQAAAQAKHRRALRIPRRPQWTRHMDAEELQQRERLSFLEWRRGLVELQENDDLLLTPFERNIDFWRQLWRVIERSDVVVQIVDARHPLLFRCADLEAYVKEVDPTKKNLLLVNKADLLTEAQRDQWREYFNAQGIPFVFFSAALETEKNTEEMRLQKEAEAAAEADEFADIVDPELRALAQLDAERPQMSQTSEAEDEAERRRIAAQMAQLLLEDGEDAGEGETREEEATDQDGSARRSRADDGAAAGLANEEEAGENDEDDDGEEDGDLDGEEEQEEEVEEEGDGDDDDGDDAALGARLAQERADEPASAASAAAGAGSADSALADGDADVDVKPSPEPMPDTEAHLRAVETNRTELYDVAELLELLERLGGGSKDGSSYPTIGLVGYPNVGKSSTINAICKSKKVSVSATPGKTKHFQTILLPTVQLCDCPGLVFPNFANTRAELVCNGILPIDQLREIISPVTYITQRIPRHVLEETYGIRIIAPAEDDDPNRPPTAYEFLNAYSFARGFMNARGLPDVMRGGRIVLKDFVKGKLLFCTPPPGYVQLESKVMAEMLPVEQPEKAARSVAPMRDMDAAVVRGPRHNPQYVNAVDEQFFRQQQVKAVVRGVRGVNGSAQADAGAALPSSKKHNNKNKREKVRRKMKMVPSS